jgi:A/G-specific adenine glycosylase
MLISSIFISWYLQKKRDLPWRATSNPYEIWISEVVLQQTRVAQGLDYYERFLTRFPDIESLAKADIEDVMKVWQGLGYYSRARNLHAGAKHVLQQLSGIFPSNYDEIIKVKGIGEYTAAAIGAFAFNLPLAVVDGNVNRVISRIYGIHDPINTSLGIKKIKKIAATILDPARPGLHNQAIMEFGALQCTIRNPDCLSCPLKNECYAYKHLEVELLPVKINRQKVRDRYFHYLVIAYRNKVYIRKRSGKDIWQGLYDFPLIETDHEVDEKELTLSPEWQHVFQHTLASIVNISPGYRHQLTHQRIHARFFLINVEKEPDLPGEGMFLIEKKDIHKYPVAKLIENYLGAGGF